MATFRDHYRGCAIAVETEKVEHPVIRRLFRVVSVVITREGERVDYSTRVSYEGQDEKTLGKRAVTDAKTYIKNRFPE